MYTALAACTLYYCAMRTHLLSDHRLLAINNKGTAVPRQLEIIVVSQERLLPSFMLHHENVVEIFGERP